MKLNDPFQIDDRTWWSPRKSGLPVLPAKLGPDMVVSVWQGSHPSPEFKGYKVWFIGYRKTLGALLKQAYGGSLADLLPSTESLFSKFKAYGFGGTVTFKLGGD